MRPLEFYREGMSFSEYESILPDRYHPQEENVFGAVLDQDLSDGHIDEDPLIKNFAQANHFLDYDMSLRRVRMALRIKFFFKGLFGRK